MRKLILFVAVAASTLASCGKYSKECRGIKRQYEEIESEIKRNEMLYYEAIQNGQIEQANNILKQISYYNQRLVDNEKYYNENCN